MLGHINIVSTIHYVDTMSAVTIKKSHINGTTTTLLASSGGAIVLYAFLHWKNYYVHFQNLAKNDRGVDSSDIAVSQNSAQTFKNIFVAIQKTILKFIATNAQIAEKNSIDKGTSTDNDAKKNDKMKDTTSLQQQKQLEDNDFVTRRIYENKTLIDNVLHYWFVQHGPTETAQKKLWMISSQSDTYRQQIDYDIVIQFSTLLIELSSSFTSAATTQKAEKMNRWYEWCHGGIVVGKTNNNNNIKNLYGYHGKLAAIIVLDQFSRHIHRWIENQVATTTTIKQQAANDSNTIHCNELLAKIPNQTQLDQYAYTTSQLLMSEHLDEIQAGTIIPIPQFIFGIMPYRHTSILQSIEFVQSQIESIMTTIQIQQHDDMVKRFRKATNRRLAVLQDEQRRTGVPNTENTTGSSIRGGNDSSKDCSDNNSNDVKSNSNHIGAIGSPNNDPASTSKSSISTFSDDDILECFPFDTDMMQSHDHTVHQTIRQFLEDRGIFATYNNNNTSSNKTSHQQQQQQQQHNRCTPKRKNGKKNHPQQHNKSKSKRDSQVDSNNDDADILTANDNDKNVINNTKKVPIIVSLSGGVDSMVIARVLAHLRSYCGYDQLQVIAGHIDYANRPESYSEAAYVKKFCTTHNIQYHCRRIDEVTRGITNRDDYEKIARTIRYQFYRDIIQQCTETTTGTVTSTSTSASTTTATAITITTNSNGTNTQIEQQSIVVGVMLGHHRGDLRENVLSNSHKGCGPLELSGMTIISKNDGVTLYRPLLSLEKVHIYDYAHTYGVPYFKDTTPHWSTRGKLRNKLLPLLEEIYGEGCLKNLSNLAIESDECKSLLDTILLHPFMEQIQYKPLGISFETDKYYDKCFYFWKVVLRDVLHSAKLGMFTDKSVASYVERIQVDPELCIGTSTDTSHCVKEGWLQCRKDYSVYLRQDGRTYVLYPSTFPWHKNDYFDCSTIGPVPIPIYGDDIMTTSSSLCNDLTSPSTVQEFSTVVVGPWHISVQNLGPIQDGTNMKLLLNTKAYKDMDDFMNGHVEYCLEVPSWYKAIPIVEESDDEITPPIPVCSGMPLLSSFVYRPLVFTKFTKGTRPISWKNLDTKIQDTLPLLGNDMDALDALKDPYEEGAVHTVQNAEGNKVNDDDNDDYDDDDENWLSLHGTKNPVFVVKIVLSLSKA